MWFLEKFLKILSGGILDRVLVHLERKHKFDNDKEKLKNELVIAAISAEIDERKAIAEQTRLEHGWAVVRWIRPTFAYMLAVYYGAIILDSIFNFAWDVAELPPVMMEWSWIVLTFYFGGRVIEKVARTIVNGK